VPTRLRSCFLGSLLIIAGWAGWGVATALAQPEEATLRVLVTSADNGRTLAGANAVLSALASDATYAGATNLDGYLALTEVPPGRYALSVSFVGFSTYRDTLSLADGIRTLSIALSTEEQALDELEIIAEGGATRRAAGLQTVGASDLERIPTPGPSGDLASYLQTLPGVVSGGSRGGELHVRGGSATQNLVLVDGLPITKPFHISSFYSAFPQDVVKNVDLYAGGFGAEYLGSTSSVMDITLRRGNMQRFVGSGAISPFITSVRLEGPIEKGRRSLLGVVRRSTLEETAGPLFGQDVPLMFYDMTGRYALQRESATCNFTGIHTYDEGRINLRRESDLTWSNTTLGGRCLVFGEDLNHTLDISAGFTRFNNTAGTAGNPERTARFWKGFTSIKRAQNVPWGTVDVGTYWMMARYSYALDEKFVALDAAQDINGAIRAHARTDIEFGNRVTVSPSIGSQFSGRLSAPTYEPRLRMTYRPDGTDRQEVSLALGKYNQVEEGLTDKRDAGTVFTVWTATFADQRTPQALHGILGYRQRLGSSVELSIEGYGKDLQNIPVPQWTPLARFSTELTVADGLAYGADVRGTISTGPFYLFVGYGWSTVTYQAGTDDLGAWIGGDLFEYAPSHDRRHQVNAVASYEMAGVMASANWEFGSGRPYTQVYGFDLALRVSQLNEYPLDDAGTALTYYGEPYGARLPTYHRLDVSLSRSFDLSPQVSLEAKAGAINTYNRNNVFYYDINSLERVNQTPFLPYVSIRVTVD